MEVLSEQMCSVTVARRGKLCVVFVFWDGGGGQRENTGRKRKPSRSRTS